MNHESEKERLRELVKAQAARWRKAEQEHQPSEPAEHRMAYQDFGIWKRAIADSIGSDFYEVSILDQGPQFCVGVHRRGWFGLRTDYRPIPEFTRVVYGRRSLFNSMPSGSPEEYANELRRLLGQPFFVSYWPPDWHDGEKAKHSLSVSWSAQVFPVND